MSGFMKTIAVIGGTGKEGKGLAYRWALSGYKVIIGSRSEEKALMAVDSVLELSEKKLDLQGMQNEEAAKQADIAVLTVPFSAHISTLESVKPFLSGKILIDVTVPLVPPKVSKVQMPPAGSALQEAKLVLGEEVKVAAAFQNISYEKLFDLNYAGCEILVCGEGKETRQIVLQLVKDAGLIGWDAGPIENAVVVEGLTSILIGINKNHGVHSAGIKITGVNGGEA